MRFSIWELILILAILLVLFGSSKIRNLGSDLGAAVRSFNDAFKRQNNKDENTNIEDLKEIKEIRCSDNDNYSREDSFLKK